MALIGVAIASSFGLALLIGPILFNLYGAKSIFIFSALSGLIGLWILFTIIPSPLILSQNLDLKFQLFDAKRAVCSFSLWRLNVSAFILHYLLISGFCAFPLLFDSTNQIQRDHHSYYYLLLLFASLISISPLIYFSDRISNTKIVILTMIGLCILSCFLLVKLSLLFGAFWCWPLFLGVQLARDNAAVRGGQDCSSRFAWY